MLYERFKSEQKTLSRMVLTLFSNKKSYRRYGLGSVEFKSGKNHAAIKCFRAASNLNPSNSIIMCCIGNVINICHDY